MEAILEPLSLNFFERLGDWLVLHLVCKNLNALLVNDLIKQLHKDASAVKMQVFVDNSNLLFISCIINGFRVKTFVDTGAMGTVMSDKCAKRCKLMPLVDKCVKGVALGVGSAKIIGKLHDILLEVVGNPSENILTSLMIVEDLPFDLLLGMDAMRRHKLGVDMIKNELTFENGNTIPFCS